MIHERRRNRRSQFPTWRFSLLTRRSSRSRSWPPSATRTPRSSACARATTTFRLPGGVLQRNNIHIAVCEPGTVAKTCRRCGQPDDRQGQGQVHPGDRRPDARGRGPGERRNRRLRLRRLPRPLRLLPAAGRHHHRQADQGKPVRHSRHRPPEQALCRAAEGQPGLGHGRAPPGHEPLHGPADLLLLRRGHRHLQRRGLFTATVEQMSERDASNTHEVIGEIFRAMNTQDRPTGSAPGIAALGRRVPLRERRPVLRQPGRAAFQPHRPVLSAAHRQPRTGRRSTRTSSAR